MVDPSQPPIACQVSRTYFLLNPYLHFLVTRKANPAWDFHLYIPHDEVGKRYRMVMRAKLLKFTSQNQLERETAKCRRELGGR